jgi:para-nitrobenzyl esterase
MATYWTNFVKSGNPNGPGLPSWPTYAGDNRNVLYLDDLVTAGLVAHPARLTAITRAYSKLATDLPDSQ